MTFDAIYSWIICFPHMGFSGGLVGKESACNADARDAGLISGPGRSPAGGPSNLLPYYCLEIRIPWTEEPGGLPSIGSQSRMWLRMLSPMYAEVRGSPYEVLLTIQVIITHMYWYLTYQLVSSHLQIEFSVSQSLCGDRLILSFLFQLVVD